mmetsp:Transcript_13811/g.17482  ORF Transcript_13811/g.17482 Transcript_13811/m.17482 type:complete len:158 (+) Transcript_13811:796-1269(+)
MANGAARDGNLSDFERSNHASNNGSALANSSSSQGPGSRGGVGFVGNNNDLTRQFNNLDVKNPLVIRKNSPLVSSGLGATSSTGNSLLNRGSTNLAQESIEQNYPFLGLQNRQYYTCFMNSILQSLIATPNFLSALVSLKQHPQLNQRSQYKGKVSS